MTNRYENMWAHFRELWDEDTGVQSFMVGERHRGITCVFQTQFSSLFLFTWTDAAVTLSEFGLVNF